MNKKRIAQYCCAALVAAGVGLNIQNAIADYGIAENSLSLVAVGGSNSGSNSNSNSNSTYYIERGWRCMPWPCKYQKTLTMTQFTQTPPLGEGWNYDGCYNGLYYYSKVATYSGTRGDCQQMMFNGLYLSEAGCKAHCNYECH